MKTSGIYINHSSKRYYVFTSVVDAYFFALYFDGHIDTVSLFTKDEITVVL